MVIMDKVGYTDMKDAFKNSVQFTQRVLNWKQMSKTWLCSLILSMKLMLTGARLRK